MNRNHVIVIGLLASLAVGSGGYWLGKRTIQEPVAAAPAESTRGGKILYYRNPMGLPDTSPIPKKDPMGMDYVPVYEGEGGGSGSIEISPEKVQRIGVKSEAAAMRVLDRAIRASGRIETDERRTYAIAPKFAGWVERLHVNTTGEKVGKGQVLFEVYSPELVSAQREYDLAVQGEAALSGADQDARDSMRRLVEASRMRLKNWDVTDEQTGQSSGDMAKRNFSFRSTIAGVVLEKNAVQGMRFMPGEVLYRIADLSLVWVILDVAEQDVGALGVGRVAQIKVDAYPEKDFSGKVSFIYPTLDASTRTVKVRLEVPNPAGLLKPAMFVKVKVQTGQAEPVLTVPATAVIDSGTRQLVLVRLSEGRFEPRNVRLGGRGDSYVEILEGVAEGEQVVTSANFLIDSESDLKAALGGMEGRDTTPAQSEAEKLAKQSVRVGHLVQGKLEEIYEDGSVSISHGPVHTLGWPAMKMDFELANPSLLSGIEPGSAIDFEIVERGEGVWVITRLHVQQKHEGH